MWALCFSQTEFFSKRSISQQISTEQIFPTNHFDRGVSAGWKYSAKMYSRATRKPCTESSFFCKSIGLKETKACRWARFNLCTDKKMLGYLRLMLDGYLSPSRGQGRVLLTPAPTPASPCTGSSLSQSSLPVQKKSIWLFAGLRSCTSSDEHQTWSKANRKITGPEAKRERARSGAFFRCGGVNTSNAARRVSQAPLTTCALCVYNGDRILSNYLIPSPPLVRGSSYFCDAVSSSRGGVPSQHCICNIKLQFLELKPWSHFFAWGHSVSGLVSATRKLSALGMALLRGTLYVVILLL